MRGKDRLSTEERATLRKALPPGWTCEDRNMFHSEALLAFDPRANPVIEVRYGRHTALLSENRGVSREKAMKIMLAAAKTLR